MSSEWADLVKVTEAYAIVPDLFICNAPGHMAPTLSQNGETTPPLATSGSIATLPSIVLIAALSVSSVPLVAWNTIWSTSPDFALKPLWRSLVAKIEFVFGSEKLFW